MQLTRGLLLAAVCALSLGAARACAACADAEGTAPVRFLLTFDDGPNGREKDNPTEIVLDTVNSASIRFHRVERKRFVELRSRFGRLLQAHVCKAQAVVPAVVRTVWYEVVKGADGQGAWPGRWRCVSGVWRVGHSGRQQPGLGP